MKRCSGFTLIESLFSLLLVLTLLGLVATLMRQYSNVARYSAARDDTLDGVQFALTEMANELGSAQEMLSPDDSETVSPVLRFRRINPALQRFPNLELADGGDGEPQMWNHKDQSRWMTVEFMESSSGALVRQVTPPGSGPVASQTMCPKIDGLQVTTLVNDSYYLLQLSFKEDTGLLRTYTVQARKWVKA